MPDELRKIGELKVKAISLEQVADHPWAFLIKAVKSIQCYGTGSGLLDLRTFLAKCHSDKRMFKYADISVRFFAAMIMALFCSRSLALNILITNDDGVEASTIHALREALRVHGHSVVISSETQDNSGKGGAGDFFKPLGSTQQDSKAGAIKTGASGVGLLPGFSDVYYVDSTPIAAVLFGIDIASKRQWGALPDLIISGPNFGNNTGAINNASGTVNAALMGLNRGIPSIAVNSGSPRSYRSFDKLEKSDPEYEVAQLIVRLIMDLERYRGHSPRGLLPPGIALNINIPEFRSGELRNRPMRLTKEGLQSIGIPTFVEDLSIDPGAAKFGIKEPALPGVSIEESAGPPELDSEQHEVGEGAITVSPLKGNHAASGADVVFLRALLRRF